MVPVYILGILLQRGPQHGYSIKNIVAEQLSDFAKIKLPTIYYHLNSMQQKGLIVGDKEKSTSRPEKTIYSITEKGIKEFNDKLNATLEFNYSPSFASDSTFYFSNHLDSEKIIEALVAYISKLQMIMAIIKNHQFETMRLIPKENTNETIIIFNHHLLHYKAEEQWAKDALTLLKQKD